MLPPLPRSNLPAFSTVRCYDTTYYSRAIDADALASSHAFFTAAWPTATDAPRRRSASRSAAASASAAGTSATPSGASRPPSASSSARTAGADGPARTACRRRAARGAASTTRGSGAAPSPGGAPGTGPETSASLPRCPRFVRRFLTHSLSVPMHFFGVFVRCGAYYDVERCGVMAWRDVVEYGVVYIVCVVPCATVRRWRAHSCARVAQGWQRGCCRSFKNNERRGT